METPKLFLFFSDWSIFVSKLDNQGFPHVGRIIKVYGSDTDPKELFAPTLTVVEGNDSIIPPTQVFDYPQRGAYSGSDLESRIDSVRLGQKDAAVTRALFRFANENGFCQRAMAAKKPDGSWLIDHPLEDLDGFGNAGRYSGRISSIHLDIFYPESIKRLREIVDIDNSGHLAPGKRVAMLIFGKES